MRQKARQQNLVDLVDYQEGSVVSKTLIKKEAGHRYVICF